MSRTNRVAQIFGKFAARHTRDLGKSQIRLGRQVLHPTSVDTRRKCRSSGGELAGCYVYLWRPTYCQHAMFRFLRLTCSFGDFAPVQTVLVCRRYAGSEVIMRHLAANAAFRFSFLSLEA